MGHRVLSILCICHLALCSDEYDTAGFVLSFVWYRQNPAYDGRAYLTYLICTPGCHGEAVVYHLLFTGRWICTSESANKTNLPIWSGTTIQA